jgi:hypothetical protein
MYYIFRAERKSLVDQRQATCQGGAHALDAGVAHTAEHGKQEGSTEATETPMDDETGTPVQTETKRPLSVTILGGFSQLLGVVTGIPQLY